MTNTNVKQLQVAIDVTGHQSGAAAPSSSSSSTSSSSGTSASNPVSSNASSTGGNSGSSSGSGSQLEELKFKLSLKPKYGEQRDYISLYVHNLNRKDLKYSLNFNLLSAEGEKKVGLT